MLINTTRSVQEHSLTTSFAEDLGHLTTVLKDVATPRLLAPSKRVPCFFVKLVIQRKDSGPNVKSSIHDCEQTRPYLKTIRWLSVADKLRQATARRRAGPYLHGAAMSGQILPCSSSKGAVIKGSSMHLPTSEFKQRASNPLPSA